MPTPPPRWYILKATGTVWRARCRLACNFRVTLAAGQWPPGILILCEYQRVVALHKLSRVLLGAAGPVPWKTGALKCLSPPTPGARSWGLPSFPVDLLALGGQPQIPRLPAPIYLSPSPAEVNWFAPEFTFSSSPFFFLTRHVASIKAKNQTWKNTTHYIHGSMPGYFVFLLLVHPMGWTWGPRVPKWNNTNSRR